MLPTKKQKLVSPSGAPLFEGSFSDFYKTYFQSVRSIIFRITGVRALDDLVQESFIKMWKGLSDFQYRCSLKTWVYRVTTSVALDYCRKRKRLAEREVLTDKIDYLSTIDPTNQIETRELAEIGLKSLEAEDRAKLVMIHLEGFTYEEGAEILTISVGALKADLHRIRKELIQFYEKRGVALE